MEKFPNKRNKMNAEQFRLVQERNNWLWIHHLVDGRAIVEYSFDGSPVLWEAELSAETVKELGLIPPEKSS